jgi:RNA polymerase subunit RPABC4/transcription elongation factor Spt4
MIREHYYCPHCGLELTENLVQLLNPRSHTWVVVDKERGAIIKRSRTSTPYKHIVKVGK